MESTAQQNGNSAQPPIIQETMQTFPQTLVSAQFTQNSASPASFNQISPLVQSQAQMSSTAHAQASSSVTLKTHLFL